MPVNPFPTLKDWQQKKKDYGIPGKVIKSGAFGEKMDKLRMAYNSAGGTAVDTTNFPHGPSGLEAGRWPSRRVAGKSEDDEGQRIHEK
jgi:hypothetical protein